MTKEITKSYILQQIQDKFKLRELVPEVFSFQETVVPVYHVEPHLTKWEIKREVNAISGTGASVFFQVPGNETWILRSYTVEFLGVPTIKLAGAYIQRGCDVNHYIYLDLEKNQILSYVNILPEAIHIDSGDQIFLNVDDFTSGMSIAMKIDVKVEEVR